jgi:phospholipase/carboxylesterase
VTYAEPVVVRAGSTDPAAPLVVLLHGRGSHEGEIIGLADLLPQHLAYAAVRAPIAEGGGFAWFANRGIGRPLPDSLRGTMDWFRAWVDVEASVRPVTLVGFSGGGAFAGGLLLDDPARWAGAAVLFATLPWDADVPTEDGRLAGARVLAIQGDDDVVIPVELQRRTWDWLLGGSGADLTTHRTSGGHGLDQSSVDVLTGWLAGEDVVGR